MHGGRYLHWGSAGDPPDGTTSLLARNTRLPMGLDEALAVALGGVQQTIDASRVNETLFVVMAALGLDARMLSRSSDPLKKRLAWFAYAISAVRQLGDRPMRLTVSADGGRRRRMRANVLIVGNVGWLPGGLPLLPGARPDDGHAGCRRADRQSPDRVAGGNCGHPAARPAHGRIYRIQLTKPQVTLDQEPPWELDGEVIGSTRRLTVVAQPGGLLLRMPPESP